MGNIDRLAKMKALGIEIEEELDYLSDNSIWEDLDWDYPEKKGDDDG